MSTTPVEVMECRRDEVCARGGGVEKGVSGASIRHSAATDKRGESDGTDFCLLFMHRYSALYSAGIDRQTGTPHCQACH